MFIHESSSRNEVRYTVEQETPCTMTEKGDAHFLKERHDARGSCSQSLVRDDQGV